MGEHTCRYRVEVPSEITRASVRRPVPLVAVELHRERKGAEQHVAVDDAHRAVRACHLLPRLLVAEGQAMAAHDASDIAVLEHGVGAMGRVVEDSAQLCPSSCSPAGAERPPQPGRGGLAALADTCQYGYGRR